MTNQLRTVCLLCAAILAGCTAKDEADDTGERVPFDDTASDADTDADTDADSDSDSDSDSDADSDSDSDADSDSDTDADSDADTDADTDADLTYDEATFKATHNSFSGGDRGAIIEQLDAGVRLIELDFHDNSYDSHGFRVGHDSPGDEVDLGEFNPDTDALGEWLSLLASWSASHIGHSPITVVLDIKDDLTDNRHTDEGSLAAVNQLIEDTLGTRLYRRTEWAGSWPTLDELAGQFVVVISGEDEGDSRKAYVRDRGEDPAVAINDHGQVVEVHKSHSHDDLWYWTGQMRSDGTIEWLHHGRYDSGVQPAVALNNEGWLVEVHKSESRDRLFYWTGVLDAGGDIVWAEHDDYDNGVTPTIQFDDLDGTSLMAIHTSDSDSDQNWDWALTLDESSGELDWGAHDRTDAELFDKTTGSSSEGSVLVSTDEDGAGDEDTLLYRTGGAGIERIRYTQLAFIDFFEGEDEILSEASPFMVFEHGDADDAADWRDSGGIARIWSFGESDISGGLTPPQFPATDTPFAAWYTDWCDLEGTVE